MIEKYIYLCDIQYIVYIQRKKHMLFYIDFINYKEGVKMEFRKLISFGRSSYVVSIPKPWVLKNRLKKGDLISVDGEGGGLVLSLNNSHALIEPKEITIDAEKKEIDLIRAEIVSAYLNNYGTINISSSSIEQNSMEIKNILRNLTGMEVMEQTSQRIVAKDLVNESEISLKTLIRRMDIITRAMMEDTILCYRGHCNYESIHNRDFDVNRLYFLGYRVLKNAMKNPRIAKSLGIDSWQLHSDIITILRLEKIADRQKRIARYLSTANFERATLAELDKIHTDISEAYNEVMKSYYNQDKKAAIGIEVTNKDRTAVCDKFLERYTNMHASTKSKTANSNLVAIAKIVENLKATAVEVRNTARTVLCYE